MLQAGDVVFVESSAQIDVGFMAWSFISSHPKATVKQRMEFVGKQNVPESEVMYALEWDTDFSGGHACQGICTDHRGQFVSAKHLSLCFEESREVITVPQFNFQRLITGI